MLVRLVLILYVFFISGCAGMVQQVYTEKLPEIEEFSNTEHVYETAGAIDDVKRNLIKILNTLDVTYRQSIVGVSTIVRTGYFHEKPGQHERRETVVAFFFSISEISDAEKCSSVSVKWIVKSKGFFDAEWRMLRSDKLYRPNILADIKDHFDNRACQ
ncbi:hypothetical protein [Halopseudomonas sp.]|uniref:hypothetical protein n=1 Tax=Halopseudomonas sp. TaxID=2901191 RepID=UPI0030033E86